MERRRAHGHRAPVHVCDAAGLRTGRGLCAAPVVASLNRPRLKRMSWSELERLVEQAENDATLRRALAHCRSRYELVLASRRLGFAIDSHDLKLAWRLHERPRPVSSDQVTLPARGPFGFDRCG